MRNKTFGDRIADVLIEDGLLLPNQLEEATAIQKQKGGRLLKILTDKQFVTDQDMAFSMGRCLNVSPVNLARIRIPEEIMGLIPREMAKANKLVPMARLNGKLFIAMVDPTNVLAVDDVKRRVQLDVVPMIATEKSVADALSGVHGGVRNEPGVAGRGRRKRRSRGWRRSSGESKRRDRHRSARDRQRRRARDQDREPDHGAGDEGKGVRHSHRAIPEFVEAALSRGWGFDPAESPPKALQLAITSRIKILAGLNIAERRVPQDGRFRIKVMGKEVDLRVSILPTSHGEKVVIRILDKTALTGSIDQMGMDEETLVKFRKAIDAPHGMILVTGPTGSGKTTTLYSVLQELNNPQYNIVTVEDPIEYELNGVNQVSVRNDIGLDFASALRSILRQDPDIVMVGEIRDNETADIAVKAALTGHQVLSHFAYQRRCRRDHASGRHGDRAVPDFELDFDDVRATSGAEDLHKLP